MINQLLNFIRKTFEDCDARDLLCFSQIIIALIQERTVNLAKLALHCSHTSRRSEARYRRIQRFISRCPISPLKLASFFMSFFKDPVLLALDRTNWSFGIFEINILVLSVIHKSYSFPLFWILLSHKGCSSPEDRINLIKSFTNAFGKNRIQALVMDREFIGPIWLGYLIQEEITFHVRLKNNIKIGRIKGEIVSGKNEFQQLKTLEKLDLPGLRKLGGKKKALKLFISAVRSSHNELVIVASNQDQEKALDRYKLRWGIETLFGCLKTRGFCFEDTHLKDTEKISNLLILLSFAFFWAFKIGEWLNEKAPITLKSHKRKSISFFRYGLDTLIMTQRIFNRFLLIPLLSPYPKPPSDKFLFSLGYL